MIHTYILVRKFNLKNQFKYQNIMRGSPINNLNYGKEESAYKSGIRRQNERREYVENSPQRINSNLNEIDYWKMRARKYQNQAIAANEELMFQNRKVQKIDELEEKLEVLIRQNTHLVEENQSLLKVIHQKKNEVDMWKFKYDSEFNNTNVLETEARKAYDNLNVRDVEHNGQVDKLLSEISRLHDQIQEIQKLHQIELDGIRSKYEAESMNQIQNLKRSQQGNSELYELNIRKLRDAVEEKGFELEAVRKEGKIETERLNGQISFLKNEIKKVEQQKQYEIELIKAQYANNIGNLTRTHKKSEEETKALYDNKIRRLGYELEEKKTEIQQCLSKIKKTGKEGELEMVRLIEEKDKLRLEIKENEVRYNRQIADLTSFYEKQLETQRLNSTNKEQNLRVLLQGEIDKLRQVIANKQSEIESLLNQIRVLKENEEIKLNNLRDLNRELKNKLDEVIAHYEREMDLLKIKISSLYQADIEALRKLLSHQIELLNNQNFKLKDSLTEFKDKLISEIQQKLLMRKDYENRLTEMNIKFEREHQQLEDLLVMAEKNYDTVRSQTSVRDIEHSSKLKRTNTSIQNIMSQKRTLENHIKNKNKEIEELNLTIQKMKGHHQRDIDILQNRLSEEQTRYKNWLDQQNKENKDSNAEKENLREEYRKLAKQYRDDKDGLETKLKQKNAEIQEKRLKIAQLEGTIEELLREKSSLDVKLKVQVGNIEKTNLELESLMNTEKERLQKIREADKEGLRRDYDNRIINLKKELTDLAKQIEQLRDSYEEEKLKTKRLETQLRNVLNSVDDRSKLQEHVINIGLSNNYFKNIAEIFKKKIN